MNEIIIIAHNIPLISHVHSINVNLFMCRYGIFAYVTDQTFRLLDRDKLRHHLYVFGRDNFSQYLKFSFNFFNQLHTVTSLEQLEPYIVGCFYIVQ